MKEVCLNFVGAEHVISSKIEEICSSEKFSVQEVIFFFVYVLILGSVVSFSLTLKIVAKTLWYLKL